MYAQKDPMLLQKRVGHAQIALLASIALLVLLRKLTVQLALSAQRMLHHAHRVLLATTLLLELQLSAQSALRRSTVKTRLLIIPS